MSWSSRKQTMYISGLTLALLSLIGLPVFLIFYQAPSCSDGKRNQDEAGVDCGGRCQKICPFQIPEPIVKWSRSLVVQKGVYNAVAYVENPNINFGTAKAPYLFRLYDKDGLLIIERKGETFVPPGKIFAIFEPSIETGERIPERTVFEFTRAFDWGREASREDSLAVSKVLLTREDSSPRVEADITNRSIVPVSNLEVVVLVFSVEGTVIGFSRTFVESISKQGTASVVFTWPKPFAQSSARVEIISRVVSR